MMRDLTFTIAGVSFLFNGFVTEHMEERINNPIGAAMGRTIYESEDSYHRDSITRLAIDSTLYVLILSLPEFNEKDELLELIINRIGELTKTEDETDIALDMAMTRSYFQKFLDRNIENNMNNPVGPAIGRTLYEMDFSEEKKPVSHFSCLCTLYSLVYCLSDEDENLGVLESLDLQIQDIAEEIIPFL